MIKHIIIWQLSDELSSENKLEIAANAKRELEDLKGKIEGLLEIKVITDKLPSSNSDMMLNTSFTSKEALSAYSVNPAHTAVADKYVRPYIKQRCCIDYEI